MVIGIIGLTTGALALVTKDMFAADFFHTWIWDGAGAVDGDVISTYVCVVISSIATYVAWPKLRKMVDRRVNEATRELHAKMDHIIHHHPDIPEYESKTDGQ